MENRIIVFNSKCCGRCGGTGRYHFVSGGANTEGKCYACSGAGFLMSPATRRHLDAFVAWRNAERPTVEQVVAAFESGRFGRAWKFKVQD